MAMFTDLIESEEYRVLSTDQGTRKVSGLKLLKAAKQKGLKTLYVTFDGIETHRRVEGEKLADVIIDWRNFRKYGEEVKRLLDG